LAGPAFASWTVPALVSWAVPAVGGAEPYRKPPTIAPSTKIADADAGRPYFRLAGRDLQDYRIWNNLTIVMAGLVPAIPVFLDDSTGTPGVFSGLPPSVPGKAVDGRDFARP
jgi:hypothetical protein